MAPTPSPCDLRTLLPFSVLIVVRDVCETRKTGTSLGPLELEVHPSSLCQYVVLSDSKKVELGADVRELLRKVAVAKEVSSESSVIDVSGLIHQEVTPS